MTAAAELLRTYRGQAGLDAEDTIALLVDFLARQGMTDSAVDALCDYLDDEGLTKEFTGLLMENGLVIEPEEEPEGLDDVD
ncbi:MAG: hypothetical protein ACQESR_20215 [Planctomycetota bacterium]